MFGLGFLAPAFLLGALAVAVPIVLHLFRRRTDRVVDLPTAGLVPESTVAQQDRRRLRDLLLLALRVAALLVLAVSFARPYLRDDDGAGAARTTMVVVDTSMSVSAPAAWREVQRLARAAVDDAPAADAVGLTAFDDRGRVVVAPTVSRVDVVEAIAALRPTAGGTNAPAGLGVALDAMAGARGRLVVVTDLQQRAWSGAESMQVPDGVEVTVSAVTVAPGNLAVSALRRDRGLTAVVQSYANGPRQVTARLAVDGVERARAAVDLAALAASEVVFAGPLPATGIASVSIDDADGAPFDNVRYLPLAEGAMPEVTVLTAEPPESARAGVYVQRALEAGADVWPVRVAVRDGRAFSTAAAANPAALVVLGTRTLDRRGRDRVAAYLRDGGHVLLALGPDLDVPTLADTLGLPLRLAPDPVAPPADDAAIVVSDPRHPVWRQLVGARSALGRLLIEQYRRVLDESGWTVLARFAGGAVALAERRVGQGTVLLFASDLDNHWNRFPLEPGFAPFVLDTMRYLTRDAQHATAFVLPAVPPGVPPVPGPQLVPAANGIPASTVVVNVDPGESDATTTTVEAFLGHVRTGDPVSAPAVDDRARTREEQQRWWQRGLAVLLAVLVVEGLLGRTGWTRRVPESG
ncbi:MAG: BatA domain-containing protein [Vicinamibacterales bacterium]